MEYTRNNFKQHSLLISELLQRIDELEARQVKQEKTNDQMKSRIIKLEKQIENLNKHFEDILQECESFADFMKIFEERTRRCSETVKSVETSLNRAQADQSKETRTVRDELKVWKSKQNSTLSRHETSIDDLLLFKEDTKRSMSDLLRLVAPQVSTVTVVPWYHVVQQWPVHTVLQLQAVSLPSLPPSSVEL